MFTPEILITLSIILLAVVLFVTEKLSVDTVSILVMVLFILTGILAPEEGFAGFSNPATITVGAMFVISESIFRTGALNNFGAYLSRIGKQSYVLCLVVIMVSSGVLSAFINDTAVVALMLPMVLQVAKESNISPSKLLIPLSFGSLMGGVNTLIGTSTNILVSGIAERQGKPAIGMFEMSGAGIWFLIAGVLYMAFIGFRLLPKRKPSNTLMEDFDLGNYYTEAIIKPDSSLIGKKLQDISIFNGQSCDILEIRRRDNSRVEVLPNTVLRPDDSLKIICNIESLQKIKDQEGIDIKDDHKLDKDHNVALEDEKLYEGIIAPKSDLVGKNLMQSNFSTIYGATVIAIRQRKAIIRTDLKQAKLQAGDVLLLKADEEALHSLRSSGDILVVSEKMASGFRYKKIIPAITIIVGVVGAAALNLTSIIVSATVGCLLLIIMRIIKVQEAYKAIDWKVIFMLAGVLSMGAALEKTGAATLIANALVDNLGQFGPQVLLSGLFLITFLSTNFMSNNATAALLAPIAIVTAEAMGVNHRPFLMAITYAASLSFMTPVGYQTNTMIYGPGNYRFSDYLKVGTPLNILFWILATFLIPLFFPFDA